MAMSGVDRMGVIGHEEHARRNREALDAKVRELRAEGWDVVARRERDLALSKLDDANDQLEGAVRALEKLANPTHRPRSEEAALLQDEVAKIARAALGGMDVIWHDDAAVIDFIDAWAHDYANDAWRD